MFHQLFSSYKNGIYKVCSHYLGMNWRMHSSPSRDHLSIHYNAVSLRNRSSECAIKQNRNFKKAQNILQVMPWLYLTDQYSLAKVSFWLRLINVVYSEKELNLSSISCTWESRKVIMHGWRGRTGLKEQSILSAVDGWIPSNCVTKLMEPQRSKVTCSISLMNYEWQLVCNAGTTPQDRADTGAGSERSVVLALPGSKFHAYISISHT